MKALSVWQPWASLLAQGVKSYETRSWAPPPALIGQRIAIHAGKADLGMSLFFCQPVMGPTAMHRWAAGCALGLPKADLPFGAILGTAVLAFAIRTDSPVGVEVLAREQALGDWSPGRWAWRLTDHHALPQPLPWRGGQGLFTVPDHLFTTPTPTGVTP